MDTKKSALLSPDELFGRVSTSQSEELNNTKSTTAANAQSVLSNQARASQNSPTQHATAGYSRSGVPNTSASASARQTPPGKTPSGNRPGNPAMTRQADTGIRQPQMPSHIPEQAMNQPGKRQRSSSAMQGMQTNVQPESQYTRPPVGRIQPEGMPTNNLNLRNQTRANTSAAQTAPKIDVQNAANNQSIHMAKPLHQPPNARTIQVDQTVKAAAPRQQPNSFQQTSARPQPQATPKGAYSNMAQAYSNVTQADASFQSAPGSAELNSTATRTFNMSADSDKKPEMAKQTTEPPNAAIPDSNERPTADKEDIKFLNETEPVQPAKKKKFRSTSNANVQSQNINTTQQDLMEYEEDEASTPKIIFDIGIIILSILIVILLWALIGLLMKMGVLPQINLGYQWFDANIYELF